MSDEAQSSDQGLSNLLHEDRRFPPPEDLAASANVTAATYEQAAADPDAFWAEQAKRLSWEVEPTEVLDWSNPPFAKWFADGTLNAAYNACDRHVEAGHGDRVAFYFEGEPGDTREITYAQLTTEVKQAANALIELGVKTGDRVAIYLPMIPEAAVAMLACARIGAPHTVVFGGFSSDALASRIQDCGVEVVITADGGYRRGAPSGLKPAVDEALTKCPDVRHVLVIRRTGQDVEMTEGRDLWWHEFVGKQSAGAHPGGLPGRAPALHHVHLRQHREAEGHPAHHRRLPGRHLVHALGDLRPQARDRRVLDRGRHRLGDRALLPGLRTAGERHHLGDVRGHSGHPAQGPLVGAHREVPGDDPLLRPDRDPHVHEVGSGVPGAVRSVVAADPRLGRRADQPGGVRLVPPRDRRRPDPGGRHLVADRDRHAHDLPDARRDLREAGCGHGVGARGERGRGQRRGAARCRTAPAATW